MIAKLIKVNVRPGQLEAYRAAQEIWNAETRKAEGYAGQFCAADPVDTHVIWLLFFWESRAHLEHWMASEHDRIAARARADAHYVSIEVRVLEGWEDAAWPFA